MLRLTKMAYGFVSNHDEKEVVDRVEIHVFLPFFPELEEYVLGDVLGGVMIDKATGYRA